MMPTTRWLLGSSTTRDSAAPPSAQIDAVATFRHLAWLTKDDPVVAETMAGWASMLRGYEPEPFRAFGPSVPSS
jgi:hypothetical protein